MTTSPFLASTVLTIAFPKRFSLMVCTAWSSSPTGETSIGDTLNVTLVPSADLLSVRGRGRFRSTRAAKTSAPMPGLTRMAAWSSVSTVVPPDARVKSAPRMTGAQRSCCSRVGIKSSVPLDATPICHPLGMSPSVSSTPEGSAAAYPGRAVACDLAGAGGMDADGPACCGVVGVADWARPLSVLLSPPQALTRRVMRMTIKARRKPKAEPPVVPGGLYRPTTGRAANTRQYTHRRCHRWEVTYLAEPRG